MRTFAGALLAQDDFSAEITKLKEDETTSIKQFEASGTGQQLPFFST